MVVFTRSNRLVFWSKHDANSNVDEILDVTDVMYPSHYRPFRIVVLVPARN